MFYIYELIDPSTNEVRYIGQTVDAYERLYNHLEEAKYGNSHKNKWIRKLVKNGMRPILNVIDEIESDIYFWEMFYINLYRSWGIRLTNIAISNLGGGDTFTNDPNKEKRRRRMSELGKLKYSNPAERLKTKELSTKAWENPILREQARLYGNKCAEMYREDKRKRMREKYYNNPEWVKQMKQACVLSRAIPIEQIDDTNNVIAVFQSASDAARKLGLSQSEISRVINNKIKHIKGFYFRKKK